MRSSLILSLGLTVSVSAWAPPPTPRISIPTFANPSFDLPKVNLIQTAKLSFSDAIRNPRSITVPAVSSSLWLIATPDVASAATAFTSNSLPAAIVAYGHYIALVGVVACLVAERLTIHPNMTPEEEDFVANADIGYGIFGALIAYTGYLRAVQYEKGFEFYAHEPLFWLKIAFVGIWGASSFFNTTIVIQRAIARKNGSFQPMGEKLAKRMIQICNAELVAVGVIPFTATLMARGVGYSNDIPWQVEAGMAAVIFAVASFKYVREAFTFEDNNTISLDS